MIQFTLNVLNMFDLVLTLWIMLDLLELVAYLVFAVCVSIYDGG